MSMKRVDDRLIDNRRRNVAKIGSNLPPELRIEVVQCRSEDNKELGVAGVTTEKEDEFNEAEDPVNQDNGIDEDSSLWKFVDEVSKSIMSEVFKS